jgi:putative endonuclease
MGRRHIELGQRGEALAAAAYEARGYRVIARNWRAGRVGEVDLVLRLRRLVVVCEVKTRSSVAFGLPAEAVDRRKQAKVRAVTAAFLSAHDLRPAGIRFDVAAVMGDRVEIIEGAF